MQTAAFISRVIRAEFTFSCLHRHVLWIFQIHQVVCVCSTQRSCWDQAVHGYFRMSPEESWAHSTWKMKWELLKETCLLEFPAPLWSQNISRHSTFSERFGSSVHSGRHSPVETKQAPVLGSLPVLRRSWLSRSCFLPAALIMTCISFTTAWTLLLSQNQQLPAVWNLLL